MMAIFYYYQREAQSFNRLEIPNLEFRPTVLSMTVDSNDILWIFTSNEETQSYRIENTKTGADH